MHYLLVLFWWLYLNYLLGAFICFSLFLIFFALFGVETGVHRRYVELLLKTFEVGHRAAVVSLARIVFAYLIADCFMLFAHARQRSDDFLTLPRDIERWTAWDMTTATNSSAGTQ